MSKVTSIFKRIASVCRQIVEKFFFARFGIGTFNIGPAQPIKPELALLAQTFDVSQAEPCTLEYKNAKAPIQLAHNVRRKFTPLMNRTPTPVIFLTSLSTRSRASKSPQTIAQRSHSQVNVFYHHQLLQSSQT